MFTNKTAVINTPSLLSPVHLLNPIPELLQIIFKDLFPHLSALDSAFSVCKLWSRQKDATWVVISQDSTNLCFKRCHILSNIFFRQKQNLQMQPDSYELLNKLFYEENFYKPAKDPFALVSAIPVPHFPTIPRFNPAVVDGFTRYIPTKWNLLKISQNELHKIFAVCQDRSQQHPLLKRLISRFGYEQTLNFICLFNKGIYLNNLLSSFFEVGFELIENDKLKAERLKEIDELKAERLQKFGPVEDIREAKLRSIDRYVKHPFICFIKTLKEQNKLTPKLLYYYTEETLASIIEHCFSFVDIFKGHPETLTEFRHRFKPLFEIMPNDFFLLSAGDIDGDIDIPDLLDRIFNNIPGIDEQFKEDEMSDSIAEDEGSHESKWNKIDPDVEMNILEYFGDTLTVFCADPNSLIEEKATYIKELQSMPHPMIGAKIATYKLEEIYREHFNGHADIEEYWSDLFEIEKAFDCKAVTDIEGTTWYGTRSTELFIRYHLVSQVRFKDTFEANQKFKTVMVQLFQDNPDLLDRIFNNIPGIDEQFKLDTYSDILKLLIEQSVLGHIRRLFVDSAPDRLRPHLEQISKGNY